MTGTIVLNGGGLGHPVEINKIAGVQREPGGGDVFSTPNGTADGSAASATNGG